MACYKIMGNVGIADMIQQSIVGLCGGTFTIIQSAGPYLLTKTLGAITTGTWNTYSVLVTTLACNRFVEVCFPNQADKIFSTGKTEIYCVICWIYGFIHLLGLMLPHTSMLHYPKKYFWSYEISPESTTIAWIHFANNITVVVLMVLFYSGIGIRLRLQISRLGGQSQLTRRQRQVNIQSFLICTPIVLGFLVWFILPSYSTHKWVTYTCGWMWMINCGINPFIYIFFSSKIRRELMNMVGGISGFNIESSQSERHLPNRGLNRSQENMLQSGSSISTTDITDRRGKKTSAPGPARFSTHPLMKSKSGVSLL